MLLLKNQSETALGQFVPFDRNWPAKPANCLTIKCHKSKQTLIVAGASLHTLHFPKVINDELDLKAKIFSQRELDSSAFAKDKQDCCCKNTVPLHCYPQIQNSSIKWKLNLQFKTQGCFMDAYRLEL